MHNDVNAGHALEDVHKYVRDLAGDSIAFPRNPQAEIPFESIQDYVSTLRWACGPDSPFIWPSESMNFEKALSVAIHLPPGYAVCVQNKRPIPENIAGVAPPGKGGASSSGGASRSGAHMCEAAGTTASAGSSRRPATSAFSQSAPVEGGRPGHHYYWDDHDAVEPEPHELGIYYHGTSAHNLPYIMAEGFRPSLGAGSEHLMEHFGVPTPGVYLASSWKSAASFPMTETTGPVTIDGVHYKRGLAGGSLLAKDGTFPMRALIRCVSYKGQQLWRRGRGLKEDVMYMPKDLHITHVILYAVRPELLHRHQLFEEYSTMKQFDEELLKSRMIDPICEHLLDIVVDTKEYEAEKYPVTLLVSKLRDTPDTALHNELTYQHKRLLRDIVSSRHPEIRVATCHVNDLSTVGSLVGVPKEAAKNFAPRFGLTVSSRRGELYRHKQRFDPDSEERLRHEKTMGAAAGRVSTYDVSEQHSIAQSLSRQSAFTQSESETSSVISGAQNVPRTRESLEARRKKKAAQAAKRTPEQKAKIDETKEEPIPCALAVGHPAVHRALWSALLLGEEDLAGPAVK